MRGFCYRSIRFTLPNLITGFVVYLALTSGEVSKSLEDSPFTLSYNDLIEEMAFVAYPYHALKIKGEREELAFYQKNSSKPFSGIASRFHNNGQVESVFYIERGKILSAKGWKEDGQTSSTHIENGTGFLVESNDMMVGFVYDKGQLIAYRGRKENGKLFRKSFVDGSHHTYDQNGQLREEGQYRDGHKHGVWKNWNHDGMLVRQINYKEGCLEGECREWHDNGVLKKHFTASDGEPHGMWSEYNEKGGLIEIMYFLHGEADGTWKSFYDEGSRKFEGSFKSDEKEGVHKWWKQNGEIEKTLFYARGVRTI